SLGSRSADGAQGVDISIEVYHPDDLTDSLISSRLHEGYSVMQALGQMGRTLEAQIQKIHSTVEELKSRIPALEEAVTRQWGKAEVLTAMETDLAKINASLLAGAKKKDDGTALRAPVLARSFEEVTEEAAQAVLDARKSPRARLVSVRRIYTTATAADKNTLTELARGYDGSEALSFRTMAAAMLALKPDTAADTTPPETLAAAPLAEDLEAAIAELRSDLPSQDYIADLNRRAGWDGVETDLSPEEVAQLADSKRVGLEFARDQRRAAETHHQWNEQAREMVASDRDGVLRALLQTARKGGQITNAVQVKACQILLPDLMRAAVTSRDPKAMQDAEALAWAYDIAGTETARALTARWQPHLTAEERHRELIAKMIFTPNAAKRKEVDEAPTPAMKAKEVADLEAELARVRAEARERIRELEEAFRTDARDAAATRDTLQQVRAQAAHEVANLKRQLTRVRNQKDKLEVLHDANTQRLTQIEEALADMGVTLSDLFVSKEAIIRLRGSTVVKNALEAFNIKERLAMKMRMEGHTDRQIAEKSGISRSKIPDVSRRFDAALESAIGAWVDRGFSLADFEMLDTAGNIVAVDSIIDDQGNLRAGARAAALSAEDRKKRIDEIMRAIVPSDRARKSGTLKRREGAPAGEPFGFDLSRPEHAVRIARAIQAVDSTAVDMLYEYWINGILSGPATHVANVVGNTANVGLEYLLQRPLEAITNTLMGGDPAGASLGEYRAIAKYARQAFADAVHHARLAWITEASLFELQWSGVGGIQNAGGLKGEAPRAAIKGNAGRIIRIPSRALLYADEFAKRFVGRIEAAAQAHRLGIAQGFSGAALDSYIATQVKTPSSPAWLAAIDKAKEMTFQQDLPQLLEGVQRMKGERSKTWWGAVLKLALNLVFPFIKTPFNIFATGLRKTPLGSLKLAGKAGMSLWKIKDGKPFFDSYPRAALARDMAEQLIGWTAMLILSGMAEGDPDDESKLILITGTRNRDDKAGEGQLLNRARGGETTILWRGKPVLNYGRYEPFSTAIVSMVNAMRQMKSLDHGRRAGEVITAML
ncbi:MAG TPA: hypothetical protein VD994_18695, partial [Prosthecobacter sp.]|nr:hypothetical protein [Prosthecobacter sp.]